MSVLKLCVRQSSLLYFRVSFLRTMCAEVDELLVLCQQKSVSVLEDSSVLICRRRVSE